ncbi:TolC family protein [Verrucomicrobiota bacterium sgz303538]
MVSRPPTKTFLRRATVVVAAVSVGLGACSRGVYRRQADREVYALTGERAKLAGANTNGWQITPGKDSRLHDPANPDHPPMPEDDPAANQLSYRRSKVKKDGQPSDESWRYYLPKNDSGEVTLDIHGAVHVAARNSHDFQKAREELYLSALDLSEQRYRLKPQFALGSKGSGTGEGTIRARTPDGQPAYSAGAVTTGTLSQLAGFGGELLVNFANTLLWDFGQPTIHTAGSLLNFSVVQPLMRYGGRARTLEPLTDSERHLLANVRRMEQYQQSFFLDIVAGRNATNGPSRGDAGVGSAPALLAGSPSGRTGTPSAGGLLGLLEEQQRMHNLESNVARLRASLEQIEAAFDAGRASSRLQVLQARQALHNAQSSLLTARASYQTRVDNYKTELGLPPDLPVVLHDDFLDRFAIFDPAATTLQSEVNELAGDFRDRENMARVDALRAKISALRKLEKTFNSRIALTRHDAKKFREALPRREREIAAFRSRPEIRMLNVELSNFDARSLKAKVEQIEQHLGTLEKGIGTTFIDLAALEKELPTIDVETARSRGSEIAAALSGLLLELSLDQAASRLEALTLPEVSLDEEYALEVAKGNRLDWMNARAELVDSWRKIDYAANPLMSGLDLVLDGDMGTTQNNSTRLDGRTGQLRGGLRIDTPLDRLKERNDYRVAQISYQRARREYMLFEDRISQSLRNTLRISQLSRMNFELRRAALQVALAQVDLARLRLEEPPRPGQAAQIGATTARDLVSALSDLLDAENEFLGLWVGHHVLRMVLDFELGTMALDPDGNWVEPGPLTAEAIKHRVSPHLASAAPHSTRVAAVQSSSQPSNSVR